MPVTIDPVLLTTPATLGTLDANHPQLLRGFTKRINLRCIVRDNGSARLWLGRAAAQGLTDARLEPACLGPATQAANRPRPI